MTAPLYPSGLPGVSRFSIIGDRQVLASENAMGPLDMRRTTRLTTSTVSVAWTFLETDYSAFTEWWENDLLDGHKRFYAQMPSAAGIMWHLCRFIDPYSANRQGFAYWAVEARLEVAMRPTTTVSPS